MSNRLHPDVRSRLFAEMRTLIVAHCTEDDTKQLLSRLNVLERDEEVYQYQKGIRIGDYVTDGDISGRVVAGPTGGEFEIRLDVATTNRGWVWRHWKSLTKVKDVG